MSEHTDTMWVILMTPQKKVLAKISKLKAYGKIKVGEWRVMYGKNKFAGWVFRMMDQHSSRAFSFYDGEVVVNTQKGYLPLRKFGFQIYMIGGILCCCWLSLISIQKIKINSPLPESYVTLPPYVEVVSEPKKISSQPQGEISVHKNKADPKLHEIFLENKRAFQFGKLESSSKALLNYLEDFEPQDRAMAGSMISERYYVECQRWVRDHEYRKAVLSCEKAMKYSSHGKAKAFLKSQEEKARQLYLEGYTAVRLDPDIAKQKWMQVLQEAKTKSIWRGKAQYQLRKLKLKRNASITSMDS